MSERDPTPFTTPTVHINCSNWGPTTLPDQFVDVPYAPFGKGDKLGKAADFTSQYQQYRQRNSRFDPSGVNTELQYRYDTQEDASFRLVDTVKQPKPKFGGRLRPWNQRTQFKAWWQRGGRRGGVGQQNQQGRNPGGRALLPKGQQQQNKRYDRLAQARRQSSGNRRKGETRADRVASVDVKAEWKLLEQFELSQLTKLQANKPDVEDLKWCGHLYQYDDAYDRVYIRMEKPLRRFDHREFYYVTTMDDPIIEELSNAGVANVFATDAIIAHLMACTRSVYPWDLVVQRADDSIYFDKREESNFDLLTVNETAYDPPNPEDQDSINHPDKLAIEATMINQNFSQQILKLSDGKKKVYENPNPFFAPEDSEPGAEPAGYAYRYRKWDLGGGLKLVARCELHGILEKRGKEELITTYALNEWDSKLSGGVEWRQKIDAQRGAVLATELKNNSCKLAKWTAQAMLAGADQMKLGYVSRVRRQDPYSHVVLGTHFYKPNEFALQIALSSNTMWGIVKMLCEFFMDQPEGKYVVMKDPNKPLIRIYLVPPNSFEESDQE